MRLDQVKARTGLSRSSIYSFMKTGAFPRSVPLGARAIGWVECEVSAWLANCIEARIDRVSA